MKPEVEVGQVYRDNDPRGVPHDIILLQCATTSKGLRFLCQRGPRKVWILVKRLQNRGVRGYTLVSK